LTASGEFAAFCDLLVAIKIATPRESKIGARSVPKKQPRMSITSNPSFRDRSASSIQNHIPTATTATTFIHQRIVN